MRLRIDEEQEVSGQNGVFEVLDCAEVGRRFGEKIVGKVQLKILED